MKSFYFTMKLRPDRCRWGYVKVIAEDSVKARQLMIDKYGLGWGFEYHTLEEIHSRDRTLISVINEESK